MRRFRTAQIELLEGRQLFGIHANGFVIPQPPTPPPIDLPIVTPVTPEPPITTPDVPPVVPTVPEPEPTSLDVKDFGARGDGVTDDRSAIQKAVAALKSHGGGTLVFPPGVYRIGKFIDFTDLHNFDVSGAGATLQPLNGTFTGNGTGDILWMNNCSGFTISGLTFDGNRAKRSGTKNCVSLRLTGSSGFTVQNCSFSNAVLDDLYVGGIQVNKTVTGSHDGTIKNCVLDGAVRSAVSVVNGSGLTFTGNTIRNVSGTDPGCGINIESNLEDSEGANHDIKIDHNTFSNIAQTGVRVTSARHPRGITIDSNHFDHMPVAIQTSAYSVSILNNLISNISRTASGVGSNAAAAILVNGLTGGDHVLVNGNQLDHLSGLNGIYIHKSWTGPSEVTNNRVTDVTGKSIAAILVYADDSTITGNIIERITGGVGIGVSANSAYIYSNGLTGGSQPAIWCSGHGHTILKNMIQDFGLNGGGSISTASGSGGSFIDGNVIRKTEADRDWIAILSHGDTLGTNYRMGLEGLDGPF